MEDFFKKSISIKGVIAIPWWLSLHDFWWHTWIIYVGSDLQKTMEKIRMFTSKLIILIGIILTNLNCSKTCYPAQKTDHDIEKSNSIIKIDVGGQVFKSHIKTLTKYPDSMLAGMFNDKDQGMAKGSPSKEKCAICKSKGLLSWPYIVNLMVF